MEESDHPVEVRSPERVMLGREQWSRLVAAVGDLPERTRQAFVLHRFEEMNYAAIARHMGISDTEALDRWMRDDAANALAWRDVHDTDAALDQIRDDTAIAALRADALGDAAPVRHWRRSAIAAALLITVGVGTFAIVERDEATTTAAAPTPRHYAATDAIGRITLTDGSVVTLDAGSAIDVAPMGTQRRIVLRSGRAGFAVAKDAAHPFVVTAGAASVTALGTHFTVERR
ncbi:hypothetical protein LTR94_029103, partial [Friedmanniomyces endolithicus]